MEDINKAYATFAERDCIASLGGGAAKIDIQHESGRCGWITSFLRKSSKSYSLFSY